MKKRSFVRQALRVLRFLTAIFIFHQAFSGKIEWWTALLFYASLLVAFVIVDAPIAYYEKMRKEHYEN